MKKNRKLRDQEKQNKLNKKQNNGTSRKHIENETVKYQPELQQKN